jgi:hypothetical protein
MAGYQERLPDDRYYGAFLPADNGFQPPLYRSNRATSGKRSWYPAIMPYPGKDVGVHGFSVVAHSDEALVDTHALTQASEIVAALLCRGIAGSHHCFAP